MYDNATSTHDPFGEVQPMRRETDVPTCYFSKQPLNTLVEVDNLDNHLTMQPYLQRMCRQTAVGLIVSKAGVLLRIPQRALEDYRGNHEWIQGGIEFTRRETSHRALARELREEIGFDLYRDSEWSRYLGSYRINLPEGHPKRQRGWKQQNYHIYLVYTAPFGVSKVDEGTAEVKWIHPNAMVRLWHEPASDTKRAMILASLGRAEKLNLLPSSF